MDRLQPTDVTKALNSARDANVFGLSRADEDALTDLARDYFADNSDTDDVIDPTGAGSDTNSDDNAEEVLSTTSSSRPRRLNWPKAPRRKQKYSKLIQYLNFLQNY